MKTPLKALALAVCLASPVALFASGTLEERATTEFGEGMGLLNRAAAASGASGMVTTTVLDGDSKRTQVGTTGTYVNLSEERTCTLDYKKKRATCQTFAQMREQLAATQEMMGGMFGGGGGGQADPSQEWEAEFSIEEIGTEVVNDHQTRHFRWTARVFRKGMTLEEGGGGILTADIWMAPEIALVQQLLDFDRRYLEAIGLPSGEEMVNLLKAYPALATAFETFEDRADEMEGTAVRTEMVLETVEGSNPPASASGGQSPFAAAKGLGKKLRLGKKKGGDGAGGSASPTTPVERLRSMSEIVSASDGGGDASIPSDFKVKQVKG